jgi:hypothetical protein
MEFIIREDRLEEVIRNLINSHYNVEEIHYNPFHDEDGNPTDVAIEYYYGDYDGDFEEEVFRLYNEDYWTNPDDFRKKISPILMIEDSDFYTNLHSMFGNKWEPIFKQWFKENFGEEVKTIDGYQN